MRIDLDVSKYLHAHYTPRLAVVQVFACGRLERRDMDLRSIEGFHRLMNPSIVVQALDGSLRSETGAMREIYPASMIKTPIAVALAADFDTGLRRPGDRKAVSAANMTANDSDSPLVPGYAATLEELSERMVAHSDNVATNELIDVVGRERVAVAMHALGADTTHVRRKLSGADPLIDDPGATGRNAHPARDAARVFRAIADGSAPRAGWLRSLLERQIWNTKLSRGLEPGDQFAHKTGDTSEVSHDGGILETLAGSRYVVVVYTTLPSGDDADDALASYMRALRPHLETVTRTFAEGP